MKKTAIALDRLENALAKQGVKLKRQQLLCVASEAFGYRNDNVFSAAAKNDELPAVKGELLGSDEAGLGVIMDPQARKPFAMDLSSTESRAGKWTISPYGNIIDVSHIPEHNPSHATKIKLYAATISHKHGLNFYASHSESDLISQLADYCREYWDEIRGDEEVPDDFDKINDNEIVNTYFEFHQSECLDRFEECISYCRPTIKTFYPKTEDNWVIACDGDDETSVLWWNQDNGWGDMESATTFPTTSFSLPDAGLKDKNVRWTKLPDLLNKANPFREEIDLDSMQNEFKKNLKITPLKFGPVIFKDMNYVKEKEFMTIFKSSNAVEERDLVDWINCVSFELEAFSSSIDRDENGHVIMTVVGKSEIHETINFNNWHKAMTYLFNDKTDKEKILADFIREAWINDHAHQIDDDSNETEIDVTFEMLLIGRESAGKITSCEADYLQEAYMSPKSIRDWTGPYTIHVEEAVRKSEIL